MLCHYARWILITTCGLFCLIGAGGEKLSIPTRASALEVVNSNAPPLNKEEPLDDTAAQFKRLEELGHRISRKVQTLRSLVEADVNQVQEAETSALDPAFETLGPPIFPRSLQGLDNLPVINSVVAYVFNALLAVYGLLSDMVRLPTQITQDSLILTHDLVQATDPIMPPILLSLTQLTPDISNTVVEATLETLDAVDNLVATVLQQTAAAISPPCDDRISPGQVIGINPTQSRDCSGSRSAESIGSTTGGDAQLMDASSSSRDNAMQLGINFEGVNLLGLDFLTNAVNALIDGTLAAVGNLGDVVIGQQQETRGSSLTTTTQSSAGFQSISAESSMLPMTSSYGRNFAATRRSGVKLIPGVPSSGDCGGIQVSSATQSTLSSDGAATDSGMQPESTADSGNSLGGSRGYAVTSTQLQQTAGVETRPNASPRIGLDMPVSNVHGVTRSAMDAVAQNMGIRDPLGITLGDLLSSMMGNQAPSLELPHSLVRLTKPYLPPSLYNVMAPVTLTPSQCAEKLIVSGLTERSTEPPIIVGDVPPPQALPAIDQGPIDRMTVVKETTYVAGPGSGGDEQ